MVETTTITKPLLDVIRDLQYKGTKLVCREGDCGACTVLLGTLSDGKVHYQTVNSCILPVGKAAGKHVITIEGLLPNKIQELLVERNGTQCGFCTPGFVLSLSSAIINNQDPLMHVDGNICRCTGYTSILKVIEDLKGIELSIDEILPSYHPPMAEQLHQIQNKADSGASGKFIAGGTDLYVQQYHHLVSQSSEYTILELNKEIRTLDEEIHLGSGVTMNQLISYCKDHNVIDTTNMDLIASTPIRNSATIAGNLINASPIGDFTIILLALDAAIKTNKKILKLDKFYQGYKKLDLGNEEIIETILIPRIDGQFSFEKVSKRQYLDIASVNSACYIKISDNTIQSIRLSAGGLSPIPLFLKDTSNYLMDRPITSEVLIKALDIADKEISPISDIRGSAGYKRLLLKHQILAHFERLAEIDPMEVLG
ncbi:MAG: FAD binding domain-containing protein [Candidatus Heimdallarchaeota archaeon]|nr:FAD binding domain-containing protein [Candidatus Heimdallarchaeota archaeon]